MKKYLTYDNVALVPEFSEVNSRSECSTETWLGNYQFKLPVMPSNMKCVIDREIARKLSENNYFYVMHRFASTSDFVNYANMQNFRIVSISVGVKKEDYDLINFIAIAGLRVDYITIDIAHGHSAAMLEMITYIKGHLNSFIIAGNVATPDAYTDLTYNGADAVKVGIGQGAACTTKLKTGFTMPMFTCIQQIRKEYNRLASSMAPALIIADGGIKYNGDIAKALVAGAHWVMAGGLFAQCTDSPAPINEIGEKVYYGSASAINKGERKHVEGTSINMHSSGLTVLETFNEITEDLKSAVSYSGKNSASQIYNTNYVRV